MTTQLMLAAIFGYLAALRFVKLENFHIPIIYLSHVEWHEARVTRLCLRVRTSHICIYVWLTVVCGG